MKENVALSVLSIIIAFICSAVIFTSPENVICEDGDSIYIERYSLFNRDTTVYKCSKPILYNGVCINKNNFGTYNAASKVSTLFKQVTIQYNEKEYTLNDYYIYDNLEIGDTCLVIEYFYPYKEIKIKLYETNY